MTTTETTTPMDRTIARINRERFEYPNATSTTGVRDGLTEAYIAGYEEATNDDETGLAFENDDCVIKAMKAQMSPETIATIADALSKCGTTSIEVNQQLIWLVRNLCRNLGGDKQQESLSRFQAD